MNRFLAAAALAAAVVLPASQPAQAADAYAIDKGHSEVSFQIRHLVTNVRGRFNDYEGTIHFDAADPTKSSVNFQIKAASIDTGIENRDKHLRSADFFDVEKYPVITFKSKSVTSTGKDAYSVTGDFTMHGVTKELTLPVTFLGTAKGPQGTVAGFETHTKLNRKDYGITWNRALDQGGAVLGEDVTVAINVEAPQAKPAAAGK